MAETKGDVKDLAGCLRRDIIALYDNFWREVDQTLLTVCKCLKEMFVLEAKALQQGVQNALRDAIGGALKSFVIALRLRIDACA